MTETAQLLFDLLRPLGGDVWNGGALPDTATQPMITWDLTEGDFGEETRLTVTAWFRGETADARRMTYLDEAEALIPAAGVLLRGETCLLQVTRGAGNFLTVRNESQYPYMKAAIMQLNVRKYGGA